jgi:hypothetical protein
MLLPPSPKLIGKKRRPSLRGVRGTFVNMGALRRRQAERIGGNTMPSKGADVSMTSRMNAPTMKAARGRRS